MSLEVFHKGRSRRREEAESGESSNTRLLTSAATSNNGLMKPLLNQFKLE